MKGKSSKAAVRCPRCLATLEVQAEKISCEACGKSYPRVGGIPILLRDPETYLRSCRRQLALVEQHAARTIRSIEAQLGFADLLPATRERCRAVISAVRDQAADIRSILQ